LFCKSCRAFPSLAKGNNLFVGVDGGKIRIKTLQEHSKTTSHSDCEGAQAAKVNPSGTPMACVLQKMSENVRERMTKLFNIAYFVAKEEAPFTMFPSLVDLHHKNGLELGDTYKNDNACRTFVQAIGQSMKDDLVEKLKNTHFFSVMSDSSVDRSVKDQEMVYLTNVEDGKPVNQFVDIVSLEHAHSQGILDAILVGLRNVGLTEQDLKSRMVGFGCDGASVMMGVHNGVAAKLKQMCPSIVPIWCVAHRLELSALDSIKSVPLLAELKETLNGVYKHYSHSAKASRELHALGKVMGINVVKPGNIDGTRWLPHMSRALEGLVKNFKVTLVHFENHASDPNDREASALMKGRARAIHRSLTQYKMVMFIHLVLDILQELKQLSLLFQRDGLTLQMVSDGLQTTTLSLVAMQVSNIFLD